MNRHRRIIVNYDLTGNPREWPSEVLEDERWALKVASNMVFADMEASQIDSIMRDIKDYISCRRANDGHYVIGDEHREALMEMISSLPTKDIL